MQPYTSGVIATIIIFTLIYMGPSRKIVIQNRDIKKEPKVGMLIDIAESDLAKVGKVLAIPSKLSRDSNISIQWMVQERAPLKPKWQIWGKRCIWRNRIEECT